MLIRICTALAWLATLLARPPSAWAGRAPYRYHGTYVGFSIESAQHADGWEDAQAEFKIDRRGFTFQAHRDELGRHWKLHYPERWIILPREGCVGVKLDPELDQFDIDRATLLLCFEHTPAGLLTVTAVDSLGVTVGEYVRQKRGQQELAAQHLRARFEKARRDELIPPRSPPTIDGLFSILRGPSTSQKIKMFDHMRKYAAQLPEYLVPDYAELITEALRDENPKVQVAALRVIEDAAHFTYFVEPLRELVHDPASIAPDVLHHVTKALGALVYEDNTAIERRERFRRVFKTTDLGEIYNLTGGVVQAEDAAILSDIFKLQPPPSRSFSADLRARALRTLQHIATAGSSPEVRRAATNLVRYVGRPPLSSTVGCREDF